MVCQCRTSSLNMSALRLPLSPWIKKVSPEIHPRHWVLPPPPDSGEEVITQCPLLQRSTTHMQSHWFCCLERIYTWTHNPSYIRGSNPLCSNRIAVHDSFANAYASLMRCVLPRQCTWLLFDLIVLVLVPLPAQHQMERFVLSSIMIGECQPGTKYHNVHLIICFIMIVFWTKSNYFLELDKNIQIIRNWTWTALRVTPI